MKKVLLNGLLYLSLSLLLFSGLQGIFGFVTEEPLVGVVTVSEKCSPGGDSIRTGKFQQCASTYINNHLGFRNTLIRLNNQVAFSLFRISPDKTVVIGKEEYLYELTYIHSRLGDDYIGRARIADRIKRVEKFQDILAEKGTDFILVFTPSKARTLPQLLPEKFRKKGTHSNYESYLDVLSKEGKRIHFLDLNRYFQNLEDTTSFPLYPKAGTHWSNFSARSWALDTLLRFMEKVRGIRMTRLPVDRIIWSDSLQNPDEDLAELMNLLFPYPTGKMPYFSVHVDSAGTTKPTVLAIADSYFWELYGWGKLPNVFRSTDFWVWNKVRYPKEKYEKHPAFDYPWYKNDLLSHDFVLLMVTEPNLPTLLDFDERTYFMFDPENPEIMALQKKRAERLEYFKQRILGDAKWSDMVREKALKKNVTFDEMVRRDAEYMLEQEINTRNKRDQNLK